MSEFVRVSAIKEFLAECPICTEQFNDTDRLPRRMTCCVQSICEPCLRQLYNINEERLSCPMCRFNHHFPGGVSTLRVESLILKILDHLKIQKGLRLTCIDCPDKNDAVARCDECCVFLCGECHKAHGRHRFYREHKIVGFEEMKDRPVESFRRQHQCKEHQQPQQFYCSTCSKAICVSCTVVEHDKGNGHSVVSVDEAHAENAKSTDETLTKLDEKAGKLSKTLEGLQMKTNNIQSSRQKAVEDVNKTFDSLVDMINKRRAAVLSDVEDKSNRAIKLTKKALKTNTTLLKKVRSSSDYIRQMRVTADRIEDLQLMLSSADPLNSLINETSQDVEFDRIGINFVPNQVNQIPFLVETVGSVRTVIFKATQRPHHVPENDLYSAITNVPADVPQAPYLDMKILGGNKDIMCPHLEWNSSAASRDVTISGSVITNTKPIPPPSDTGCRMQSVRCTLATRPLTIKRGQRSMHVLNVNFSVKQIIPEKKMIFESSLSAFPVDTKWSQTSGLSARIASCSTHKEQMCLWVRYNGNLCADVQLGRNQVGLSYDYHLCFLLDGDNNKIHVADVDGVRVFCSVTDVIFDKPLWAMTYVSVPAWSDMRVELISGSKITESQDFIQLLDTLS